MCASQGKSLIGMKETSLGSGNHFEPTRRRRLTSSRCSPTRHRASQDRPRSPLRRHLARTSRGTPAPVPWPSQRAIRPPVVTSALLRLRRATGSHRFGYVRSGNHRVRAKRAGQKICHDPLPTGRAASCQLSARHYLRCGRPVPALLVRPYVGRRRSLGLRCRRRRWLRIARVAAGLRARQNALRCGHHANRSRGGDHFGDVARRR